ncbi:MAG: AraC family transcriptional regulator, partial [Oscillospiraceae bacterium]|nr:AraC family transcriptional regulator [Oscillospiraceae bacterium]
LLSWVLAHGTAGMAWITVQTHMNTVAVATLLDMACVILPEDIMPEPDTLAKAAEEGVAVFTSPDNAYALSGKMWSMGIPAAAKG